MIDEEILATIEKINEVQKNHSKLFNVEMEIEQSIQNTDKTL